ncbi:DUF1801 domain-containing protein [Sphingomonas lenta]|uniref:YdhG-like domain-containing protein n=1 Tax=Sphingomonas lenta TaxID=1141887 RepID=A0A2A2SEH7_9SPHN|nr:DUF1801 domain-containing protein [Sphingomonas lenta]PAX07590.1 hypothetical protein CKY28_08015 [Sphingomonas lenta]
MAEDVESLLAGVTPPERQTDARAVAALMGRVSGEPAAPWGSMIGFGRYRYRYESGREGEAFRIGFAPRKSELVLYLLDDFARRDEMLARLGKHRTGKSCLYVKRLADVDAGVLEQLVAASWRHMAEKYPT